MATQNEKLCEHLVSLAQLDIDAIHAYTQAIDQIDVDPVKKQLMRFRHDHERHVKNLAPLIKNLGGTPPEFTLDFKGYLLQGMTSLRSVTGTEGALKAMRMNEVLTNRMYATALEKELPEDVRSVIEKNREDERRHLEYIQKAIDDEAWDATRKAA